MAVSDIEAVLEFLRKNGFSESESAFMEDVLEKSELRSFDFEKFLFPMVPPPPPLKVSDSRRWSEGEAEARGDGIDSSDDSSEEFVSLGSSTSYVCSSEFINPYGIHTTTRISSQASSDRLSQFGTARDYHDFDMQNDLYWYNEKDEDNNVPPYFGRSDSFIGRSEDKFVMTLESEKQTNSELGLNHMSEGFQNPERSYGLDKPWPFNVSSTDCVNGVQVTDYHHLKENVQHEGSLEKEKEECTVHSSSAPLYAEAGGFFGRDRKDRSHMNLKVADVNDFKCKKSSTYDWDEEFKSATDMHIPVANKYFVQNEYDNYEDGNSREVAGDLHEPDGAADEEKGSTADQLLMCDTNEDEYEVFNLRIIHRKNRTGFEENRDLPIVINSVIAGRYYVTEYLGSAAFSKVVQAHDLHTGIDVCLKIIKNDKDFFDQSLDEIKLLKFVNKHDPGDERHILRLYDYFYCQLITRQCLEALEYLHHLGIVHCDLKPENILIRSYKRCEIKVIDLGSSCFQTDNLCLYVQSRSYRAPEVILGLPYDQKIDLWSLGCILAELCSGEVLFPNDALVILLARMIGMLGPIDAEMLMTGQETHKYFTKDYDLYHINEETNQMENIFPEESSLEHHLQVSDVAFIDFIRDLLEINPQRRPTAREALEHPWLSHQYELSSY